MYEGDTKSAEIEDSGLRAMLSKLDNRITRAHEGIAELSKLLGPIMRPEQDATELPSTMRVAGPHSEAYDSLERLVDRAHELEIRLHDIMSRLEV